MFFFLSKTLDSFASPLGMGLSAIALAFFLRKRPRRARYLACLGFFIVYLFSLQIVSNMLWRFLERSARRPPQTEAPYDVVIVLGGMVDDGVTARRHQPEYNEHIDRLIRGADLLRTRQAKEALLSGGEGHGVGISEAEQLKAQLVDWGIAPERLVTETRSRNTHENAVFSAEIIRQHGWRRILLVTSAFHMQRALGCFAKEGIFADAAPADFHGARIGLSGDFFLPRGAALAESSAAWRELVGRVVYRLVGYSRAL